MDSSESLMSSSTTHQVTETNEGSFVVGTNYASEPRVPDTCLGAKEEDPLGHLSRMLDAFGNTVSEPSRSMESWAAEELEAQCMNIEASVPSTENMHKPRLLGERFARTIHASGGALSTSQNRHTVPPESTVHPQEHLTSFCSLADEYGTRCEAIVDETATEAEQEDVEQSLDLSNDTRNAAFEVSYNMTDVKTPGDLSRTVVDVDRRDFPMVETCDVSTGFQDTSFTTGHASGDEDSIDVAAALEVDMLGQAPRDICADHAPGTCATSTTATHVLPCKESLVSLDTSEEVCHSEVESGHESQVTIILPSYGDGGQMSSEDSPAARDNIDQMYKDPASSPANSSPSAHEHVRVAEKMAEAEVTILQQVTLSPLVSQPDDDEHDSDVLERHPIDNGEMLVAETVENNPETSATVPTPFIPFPVLTPPREIGEDVASSLLASTQDMYVTPGDSFAPADLSTSAATSCTAVLSAPANMLMSALAGEGPASKPAKPSAALTVNPLEADSLPGPMIELALDAHLSAADSVVNLELAPVGNPETIPTTDDVEMQDIADPPNTSDGAALPPYDVSSAKIIGSDLEVKEVAFDEDSPTAEAGPPTELPEPGSKGLELSLCADSTLILAVSRTGSIPLDLEEPAFPFVALEPGPMTAIQSPIHSMDIPHSPLDIIAVPEISPTVDSELNTELSVSPVEKAASNNVALPLVVVSSPDGESTIHNFGQELEQDIPQDVGTETAGPGNESVSAEQTAETTEVQARKDVHELTLVLEANTAELEDLPPSSLPSSQSSDAEPPEVVGNVDTVPDVDNPGEGCSPEEVEDANVSEDQLPQTTEVADEPFKEVPEPSSLPPSSQPRDSSPDRIFSSPPPDLLDSPPSSPFLTGFTDDKGSKEDADVDVQMLDVDEAPDVDVEPGSTLGKRPRSPSLEALSIELDEELEERDLKRPRERSPTPPPPQPLRYTAAGLKAQFKKLVKPFRSPLVKPEDSLVGREAIYGRTHAILYPPKTAPGTKDGPPEDNKSSSLSEKSEEDNGMAQKVKPFSERLTKQFKSPFAGPGSSSVPGKTLFSSTKSTQAAQIQALQAKVQKLKQAIKIKNERSQADEEDLAALVSKWRGVGRDVAWLVWDTVKDLDPGEGMCMSMGRGGCGEEDDMSKGKMRNNGFDGGWGYDDGEKRDEYGGLNKNWGWDDPSRRDGSETADGDGAMEVDGAEEQPSQPHSLGTMLRHLGIDPETLGWNEDEGDFIGEP